MRYKAKLSIAVAAICLGAGGAQADDWTGLYAGVNAGIAVANSKVNTNVAYSPTGYFSSTSTPAIDASSAQKPSATGFTAGLEGGYNYQTGNYVLGIESDIGALNSNASMSQGAAYPCCAPTGFTVAQTVRTNWSLTVRPRLGFVWGSVLVYATGGVAVADVKYSERFTDTFATALETASKSTTQAGWTAGGGIELPIAPNWSMKAEYLYYDLGSISTTSTNLTAYTPAIAFPTNVFSHTASITANVVRVGVNFRF